MAEESFVQALELAPDDTDALHNLGLVYFAQGDYEKAQKQFERVLLLDPQNEEARKRIQDMQYIAAGDSQQPSLQVQMTAEMEARGHFVRGNAFYQAGDYQNAVVEYTRALDFAPANVDILNNLGTAYSALGKRQEAEAVLKKARELSPDNETVARNLNTLNLLGTTEKKPAGGMFQISEKTEKERATLAAFFQGGAQPKDVAAPEKPKQPLELPLPAAPAQIQAPLPASADVQEDIIPSPKTVARAQTAKEALTQTLPPQAPESPKETSQTHFNKGVFRESEGDLEGALLHYREAVRLEPANAIAQYNLGNIYFRLGAFESAIECYQAALQTDASLGKSYNNIGVAYYKLGRLDEAEQAWRQALQVEPSLGSARENLTKYARGGAN